MDKHRLYSDSISNFYMAKIISGVITILGIIMTVVSLSEGNITQGLISITYGIMALISLITIHYKKTLKIFFLTAIFLVYALLASYLVTGGTKGFGILWIVLYPMFFMYLLSFLPYTIVIASCALILIIFFWTPLQNFIYPFEDFFKLRFPILFSVEAIFTITIKFSIDKNEQKRRKAIKELIQLKDTLEDKVLIRTQELKTEKEKTDNMMIELALSLAATIDAKDKYTSGHSKRVAEYSKQIAGKLGKTKEYQDKIYLIGLLHDIGKIGVPDEIINKTSRLTDDEFAIVKKHPEIGYEILQNIQSMPEIVIGVRWHHERYDGKGYPDKLSGDKIPEFAQIISVADAYDAMTSNRSYRNILPQDKVLSEIKNGINNQFAPEAAEAMISLINEDTEYKMHA